MNLPLPEPNPEPRRPALSMISGIGTRLSSFFGRPGAPVAPPTYQRTNDVQPESHTGAVTRYDELPAPLVHRGDPPTPPRPVPQFRLPAVVVPGRQQVHYGGQLATQEFQQPAPARQQTVQQQERPDNLERNNFNDLWKSKPWKRK